MTKAPPGRSGAGLLRVRIPGFRPPAQLARHTGLMAIRFAVQADTREECVAGLAQLVRLDLVPVMLPVLLTDNRWMARAVPRPAAPADDGQERGASATR